MTLDLSSAGITHTGRIYRNLGAGRLVEEALRRGEGILAKDGPLVTRTGQYTGRSPDDKFTVLDETTKDTIWWGKVNRAIEPVVFDRLHDRVTGYLQGRDVFVQDCYAGADPNHRLRVRIITEQAWHSLFAHNMFVRETDPAALETFEPQFTVIQAPGFKAVPDRDGTHSEAFILANFTRNMVLIGGTSYAGEIKKSIFTVLNYILPERGVLGMHCSANVGPDGTSALFFGLSGTGKTTLSTDSERALIGDDEHGWSKDGIFNFEGGCYAKMIRLSAEAEPEIYRTSQMFGTILENVVIDEDTRVLDLDSAKWAENTRGSYPITSIPNVVLGGTGGHPKTLIMLTADAFGVLPPISKLTAAQAMYHFISGYTAKVAGTERGIKEPVPNFSTCFGAPFMARHPAVYAKLLGENIARHGVTCWLVNTGWTGGPYGEGSRMPIKHTRAMVRAALSGELAAVPTEPHPIFGVHVPVSCPGVDAHVLNPRSTWKNHAAYDATAQDLARKFAANFEAYKSEAAPEVIAAGPRA
ncbi:MAG: phosphoenolpyruvate carboxykinase [ATP] 1 [Myxococcales bacterium]